MPKNDNGTIETLYKRFFQGEKEAVAELAQKYRQGLILFINGYVRDADEAEDLASDTFAALLVKRPKIKDTSKFKTYLFSMAKHLALSRLRKRKKERNIERDASHLADPELLLIEDERRKALAAAIATLPTEYRETLLLRYFEELTAEEIAKVLKKNKKQVYNLLQRAKTALKHILTEEGIAYETD